MEYKAPVKSTVASDEIKRVKGLGFLRNKLTEDKFNCRVLTRNGKLTAERAHKIIEAAEKFGSGEIALTSRMTVEIQGIPYSNIDEFCKFLDEAEIQYGGTGPRVRPVVSCKGTTCTFGLIDTFALADEIHEKFYTAMHDVKLPHKFKIAVGGCPNNCVKPDLNDIGIIGQLEPYFDADKCRSCKVCQVEKACPIKAATLIDGKLNYNTEKCNRCGRCLGKCPFGAFGEYTNGYRVYIGGRWGKQVARGRALGKLFTSKEDVLSVIEKAIIFFRDNGNDGERFADTINRIGFENVEQELIG